MVQFLNSLEINASMKESAKELQKKIEKLDTARINKLAVEEIAKEFGVQVLISKTEH